MITEAGIIGKIGFNIYGIGTLLNGIRAIEAAPEKMPIYFALRTLFELFKDEQNFPASINRRQAGNNDSNTLFNVVYNFTERKGVIYMGRTTEIEEQKTVAF
ncbi:hypothetical protein BDV06DRAFT_226353 [Aspergillus oleicola]